MKNIKLSTPINIKKVKRTFGYDSVITSIGSCFAQYVMEHLEKLGFNASYNPNGIVYNAVSIAKSLHHIVNNKKYDDTDFINDNDQWYSWEHHGSFSDSDVNQLKKNIFDSTLNFRNSLAKSDVFILTPSSSVVSEHMTHRQKIL